MKLRRSLYARPVIVRGQQCAEAPLGHRRRDPAAVAVQPAVSRWQVPHRRAVMVAERRVCRPQQHGSPSQRCRSTTISGCPPCLGRPVRVHMSSVRPSSVRRPARVHCPASGTCPASARLVSARPRSSAVSAFSVQCERPASVSTLSAPVSSWSAWVRQAATRPETGRPGNYLTRGSLSPDWSHGLKHLRFMTKVQALCQTSSQPVRSRS